MNARRPHGPEQAGSDHEQGGDSDGHPPASESEQLEPAEKEQDDGSPLGRTPLPPD